MIREILQLSGALTGICAAILWFFAASIKVYPGSYGGLTDDQRAKINRQGNWNALAAAITGLSILLQTSGMAI